MTLTPSRPVLRYHGGKWKLAKWIISHMPPHRTYVEPFGGGGSVLMRKPRAYAEVYNDLWGTVVNVFRVMRDPGTAEELAASVALTPFAREEFSASYHDEGDSDVERARKTIFRSLAGFGSAAINDKHATGFRANSNRSGTIPALDWRNYPREIPAFVERLRGVVIEHRDALSVIAAHDSPETLFYVDPPYPHATRNVARKNGAYAVEMTDTDHAKLADCLRNVRGMVLLSSYHSPLYETLYGDWVRVDRGAFADGAAKRIESLYANAACAAAVLTA